MNLARIYSFLKRDLDIIEESLNEVFQAEHPILHAASTELLKAGGKRIRPVFVILSGQLGRYQPDRVKTVAVSLELIHMATLVHDDVIDDASLRRGQPTIRELYGNRVAMYTGDYILARALEEITQIEDAPVHQLLSRTIVEVCVGEIEQIKDKYNWDQGLRDYLRRIKRKTALLIATSCQLGALVSDLTEAQANNLYKYGYYIGMSYQIIDDILDFTSTEKELGKPSGSDLLQGNITLPVLYAMKDKKFASVLKSAIQANDTLDEEQLGNILYALKNTDAIEQSYQLSELYLQKALKALEELPEGRAKHTLENIAKYIGKRRS
ncbi:heptaprenyl diphosphate synthase component 2 [Oceanobacillus picturae]|uniref:Heptaprenyl diphosphate synthase component 2 n=1 Tax=Oceanobacillus picturae TaxID=171693 RepID=A0A0U9H440_9BACI|nr:heptaprenyl diphosphate synthase component II [Oceanobacillus picturae]RIU96176.1 heptaprenyl diphosphate synthase component II [Oceanobacillus picturae]GAQ17450.1 heptaprenyl diphosphate synthase component 2 [Oceanobacillus picturae]